MNITFFIIILLWTAGSQADVETMLEEMETDFLPRKTYLIGCYIELTWSPTFSIVIYSSRADVETMLEEMETDFLPRKTYLIGCYIELTWSPTFSIVIYSSQAAVETMLEEMETDRDLETVIIRILNTIIEENSVSCVTIISDTVYLNLFEGALFKRTYPVPIIMVVVTEYEDLLSPNYDTLESIRQARRDGCGAYVILLSNGLQASRLLKFGDRYRIIDTRAIFLLLHDYRLFKTEMHYIWKRIVNVVFLRHHPKIPGSKKTRSWFDITTVPFPSPIKDVLVPRRVDIWRNERFHSNNPLFTDKTRDLNGQDVNVVYVEHVPAVISTADESNVGGLEIEILYTLANWMNFNPKLYKPENAELYKWGYKLINGTFSGLLGEMVMGHAEIALGNLQYNPYHLELTDLTVPYISQCYTFLTPEALTDNSWQTLILPFKLYMWIAVLLVLLVTGIIFYVLAKYYLILLDEKKSTRPIQRIKPKVSFGLNMKRKTYTDPEAEGLYVFGELINSILYTYGMLLVVSLPKLPTGWSIRLLTGWYWLYCLLLVVAYRASMTAILANPAPRVTIDTLQELVDSKVTCGGWGAETKKFFTESFDEISQKIGEKFEITNDPDTAVKNIGAGKYAYYDNAYYLKYISVKRQNLIQSKEISDNSTSNVTGAEPVDGERNLHIMADCVVSVPISVGLQKNSPLKPRADKYIRRIIEVGLVEKWLNDAMYPIRAADTGSSEQVKALMNLKKLYGAFIALAAGYLLSLLCLIGELIDWHLIVKRDPNFDKYALDIYYAKKRNKKLYSLMRK